MVNEKMKRKIIMISTCSIAALILVFSNSSTICLEVFFKFSLSDPNGPADRIYFNHYAAKGTIAFTPVAVDHRGYIYILAEKNKIQKLLVIDFRGQVKRIVTIKGQNNFDTMWLGVSPSGKWIWRLEHWDTVRYPKIRTHWITVHDYQGRRIQSWQIKGHDSTHWIFGVPDDNRAYALMLASEPPYCFVFTIGKKQPQRFEAPIRSHTSFHRGRFWFFTGCKELSENIGGPLLKEDPKQSTSHENWLCVGTWSPEEMYRVITKFKKTVDRIGIMQWIDEDGNLYCYDYEYRWDWLSNSIVNFLSKIKPLGNLITSLESSPKPAKVLLVLSQKGKVLYRIVLQSLIRPVNGENLDYGQLIKVDEKGIYMEVWRKWQNEREYRIILITKKRRWQVWWETLRSWFSPDDI